MKNGFIIVSPTQAINGLIKVAKLKQLSNMGDLKKSLLCVWLDYEGVVHFELVPKSRVMISKVYCEQLDLMYTVFKEK